jgi:DNA-binding MarR family transcriptional regulator
LIRQNQSSNRKPLSDQTALNQPAITKITDDLIERGLVVEREEAVPRQGLGREPIGLSIN